jgi:hypothetical protein
VNYGSHGAEYLVVERVNRIERFRDMKKKDLRVVVRRQGAGKPRRNHPSVIMTVAG